MMSYERIPLKEGDVLQLKLKDSRGVGYSQKAVVEKFISGTGASCLTYTVALYKDDTNYSRMIMKEFYPKMDGIQIQRENKRLVVSVDEKSQWEYFNERIRFQNSYALQNKLSGSDAMEIMVKPYQMAEYGDSLYLLSDLHKGEVLDISKIKDFSQKIWLIYRMAEAMQLLHEQGYLYMDIKPSNILWIESQQIVKLFDVDSIVPYKKINDVHGIRVTKPYVAPELKRLEKWFEIKKKEFLRPAWDVYCLGLLLFELVFGRFPTEEDLKTACGQEGELEKICGDNKYDEDTCALLKEILKRSLSERFRTRYSTAQEMCEAVNELKKRVDARAFITKKEFVKANATMKAYYMLDRWPVYEYGRKEEKGQQILDVAIIGDHSMRDEVVKAIYSCTHMLNTVLRIRLYAEDVKEFWRKLEEANPLLGKTVKLYVNGKWVNGEHDRRISSRPIAEVYLYEKKDIVNLCSDYIILLENKSGCRSSVRRICEKFKNAEKKLVTYLDDGTHYLTDDDVCENIKLVPISLIDQCSYYDEKLLESELLLKALNVHALYYRGNHKRASWEETKADFESNIYNIESSMRAALTVKYKLASVGMNPESASIADEYFDNVLAKRKEAREKFDQLTALEHLSWSSYMIVNGWNIPTKEQIQEYAFVGKNDFKDKTGHLHPCLAESQPGSGLTGWTASDWETELENNPLADDLDSLDRMSVQLHQIAKKKAKEAEKKVNTFMDELCDLVQEYRSNELQNAFEWLSVTKKRIFAGENTAESLWKQAEFHFKDTLKTLEILNPKFEDILGKVNQESRVIKEYHAFHDYKKSDEAIIYGIPYILNGDKIKRVVKPFVAEKKNRWKNIMIALYLEPEEVVFLASDREKVETEFYQRFLKARGIQTKITVKATEESRQNEVWDVTGLGSAQIERLKEHTCVMLQDGEIIGLPNYIKGQFLRRVHLSVEETFELFGETIALNEREPLALSLEESYQKIWKAYQKMGVSSWNKLAAALAEKEKANIYVLPNQRNGEMQIYCTAPVNGKALYMAEIDRVMNQCKKEGLVESYFIPGEQDELSVWVKTDQAELFEVLKEMIQKADEEPLRHEFHFEQTEGGFRVTDRCLHVKLEKLDEEVKQALMILAEYGKDEIREQVLLQNLRRTDQGCSFKYASVSVKQCLQSCDMILDMVLYYACRNSGVFDDMDIGTRKNAEAEESGIWGSRNAKMYAVIGSIDQEKQEYKIIIHCEKDAFQFLGTSEKRELTYPITVEEGILQEEIRAFFEKENKN